MNSSFLLSCFFFLSLWGCSQSQSEKSKRTDKILATEINNLGTTEKQRIFLETIFDEDQAIRNKYPGLIEKYGFGSKEYKKHLIKMADLQKSNLEKIEMYLEIYGNPTIEAHGEKSSYTPWIIVHHSSTTETRRKNFPYLYNAYISGDLDESHFISYLDRYYRMKYQKRYWKQRYKPEEKIKDIIHALDLQNMAKADSKKLLKE